MYQSVFENCESKFVNQNKVSNFDRLESVSKFRQGWQIKKINVISQTTYTAASGNSCRLKDSIRHEGVDISLTKPSGMLKYWLYKNTKFYKRIFILEYSQLNP